MLKTLKKVETDMNWLSTTLGKRKGNQKMLELKAQEKKLKLEHAKEIKKLKKEKKAAEDQIITLVGDMSIFLKKCIEKLKVNFEFFSTDDCSECGDALAFYCTNCGGANGCLDKCGDE